MGSIYQWVLVGDAIDVWIVCQLLFQVCEATCCYGGQISPYSGTFRCGVRRPSAGDAERHRRPGLPDSFTQHEHMRLSYNHQISHVNQVPRAPNGSYHSTN
jgi:hypothetical protein